MMGLEDYQWCRYRFERKNQSGKESVGGSNMLKHSATKLYQLKQSIDGLPNEVLKQQLLKQCEVMHRKMMEACLKHNESRHFMLTSPGWMQGNFS